MDIFDTNLINQHCEHTAVQGLSEKTVAMYQRAIVDLLKWLNGRKVNSFRNVATKHLKAYQNRLNQKYSPNTVIIKIRAIKQFFAFLEEKNHILLNPAAGLVLPVTDKKLPVNILTEQEIKQLLETPDLSTSAGIRDRATLELLYSTAIRRGECLNLKVHDLDLAEGLLRINLGKGSKDRILPVGNSACEFVKKYLAEVRQVKIRPESDHGYLFITLCNGKPLSIESLKRILYTCGHNTLKKPVSCHTIRRSCATHLIRAGAGPEFVQKLLGHSCPDTMQRYVRLVAQDIQKAHRNYHPRERALA